MKNVMATIRCAPRTRFLTAEDVAAIFERSTVSAGSELSSDESDYSEFWEGSDTDASDVDSETELSGSLPLEFSSKEDSLLTLTTETETDSDTEEPCSKRVKVSFEDVLGKEEDDSLQATEEMETESETEPPRKRIKNFSDTKGAGAASSHKRYRQSSRRGRGKGQRGRRKSHRRVRSGSDDEHTQCGSEDDHGEEQGQRGRQTRSRGRGRAGRRQCRRRGALTGRGKSSRGSTKGFKKQQLPQCAKKITEEQENFAERVDFCPLRNTGPHVPLQEVNALSLFELFFDDKVLTRILDCSLSYAEDKKEEKAKRYELFKRKKLTKKDIMAFIGALILLGIHGVRNHRKAWSSSKAQYLVRLQDLLTCQQFELIGTFLHVVTKEEEESMQDDRLRKLKPLVDHIKNKCQEYYQPLQQLSVDERMVKSKARCKMIQYMKNKPTKWGFKLWVLADMTGYTTDFIIYTGKQSSESECGLTYDVVMELVSPYMFQGYEVFTDNYYMSPRLYKDLLSLEVYGTGTLRVNRKEVPEDVVVVKRELEKSGVSRGAGYYIVEPPAVYVCWRDVKVVTLMSTVYPGHSEDNVTRKARDKSGKFQEVSIPRPVMVKMYNQNMGGVDKSDQYLAYHNVLRKTVRYWKTLLYHMVDVAVVNAFIVYNILAFESGHKPISENDFRDALVLQIINKYGKEKREAISRGRPPKSSCRIKHGSQLFTEKCRCQYCKLNNAENYTKRRCSDCEFSPPLCQNSKRDCHDLWHRPSFDEVRKLWFQKKSLKAEIASQRSTSLSAAGSSEGAPSGSGSRSSATLSSPGVSSNASPFALASASSTSSTLKQKKRQA